MPARAHDFWIEPSTFHPLPGETRLGRPARRPGFRRRSGAAPVERDRAILRAAGRQRPVDRRRRTISTRPASCVPSGPDDGGDRLQQRRLLHRAARRQVRGLSRACMASSDRRRARRGAARARSAARERFYRYAKALLTGAGLRLPSRNRCRSPTRSSRTTIRPAVSARFTAASLLRRRAARRRAGGGTAAERPVGAAVGAQRRARGLLARLAAVPASGWSSRSTWCGPACFPTRLGEPVGVADLRDARSATMTAAILATVVHLRPAGSSRRLALLLPCATVAHEIGTTQVHLTLHRDHSWSASITTAPTVLVNRLESQAGQKREPQPRCADGAGQARAIQPGARRPYRHPLRRCRLAGQRCRSAASKCRRTSRCRPSSCCAPTASCPCWRVSVTWRYDLVYSTYAAGVRRRDGGSPRDAMARRRRRQPAVPDRRQFRAAEPFEIVLQYLQLGFLHIVPEGLDHILFVLGIFLLTTRLRPILVQVTAFTIAHSVTLGLSMYGVVALRLAGGRAADRAVGGLCGDREHHDVEADAMASGRGVLLRPAARHGICRRARRAAAAARRDHSGAGQLQRRHRACAADGDRGRVLRRRILVATTSPGIARASSFRRRRPSPQPGCSGPFSALSDFEGWQRAQAWRNFAASAAVRRFRRRSAHAARSVSCRWPRA